MQHRYLPFTIGKQGQYAVKVAEKAKANGAKKMVQVTAKKSYAKVREELEECLTRNKLTRKELFPACFSKDT
ncbi:hypothetical protein Tco_1112305 [Tanacetum coccineum]|uniref:Uncharacterized protein n=1 Tax=Tanacetum coccineum TaxID=301880 RepID=A0ABQ5IRA4_9ASTR